ncbi:MAG: outer membrane protein assembly factor BamA [Planctomycetes bacterium]|nr:outer membrane protein assembly factor BamA [Planctomycetota bacterium]
MRCHHRVLNIHFILLASFLAACGTSGLLWSEAPSASITGKVVRRVAFLGDLSVPESRLKTLIQTREGQPFLVEAANEDIKRLNQAGFFCKEYRATPLGDGVEVVFSIDQEPVVDEIEFTGTLKKKQTKRFRELIQVRKGDLLRRHQINSDKQAILLELKSKGHHFAKVQHEILPGPAGGATVRFIVDPGKPVRVKAIEFKQATAFSRRKLQKLFKTKVDHWYNSAKYIQETFEEDVKRLREFYRMKGWLDAEATIGSVEFLPNRKKVVLSIDVQEGDPYQVESVHFQGNEIFSTEALVGITELRAGGPYSRETLQKDVKAIRDKYGEKGYVRNEVQFNEVVLKEGKKVRLEYSITEGEKAYVETIHVVGNVRTKDIVVRREVDLVPGEEFNTVKLDDSLRRLRNLGFFEKVEADYTPGSQEHLSNIDIRIKEGKTGVFRVGAGFSSNNNLIGNVAITQRNFDYKDVPKSWHDFLTGNSFVGDGQTLTLQAQPGNTVSRYRIAFTEPYLFERPLSFGMSGFYFQRDRGVFEEQRVGGSPKLGKRLMPDVFLEASYRFEVVRLQDIDFVNAPLAVIDAQGDTVISSVILELSHDKRDDVFLPSKGFRSEISYELAGTFLAGDLDFQRVVLGHSRYFTLYRTKEDNPHVLGLQVRSGWEDDIGDTRTIPIFERFFLGGANTVRGFEFRTVGPQDRDEPIGGDFFYQLNVEYRFPIFGQVFYGVLFNDVGNVTPFLGSGQEFSTWRGAVGFGIRIRVPALGPVPITLDFAFPYREEGEDDTELLSFQFGTAF